MLDEFEYERWIRSSKETLNSARGDFERGDYNWACFKAQQSAEFAVKALLRGLGLLACGHSVSSLLAGAPKDLAIQDDLMQAAKTLDKYYIPTRYPNVWAEGVPSDYYTRQDAGKSIELTEMIIEWVERSWRSLRKGEG